MGKPFQRSIRCHRCTIIHQKAPDMFDNDFEKPFPKPSPISALEGGDRFFAKWSGTPFFHTLEFVEGDEGFPCDSQFK